MVLEEWDTLIFMVLEVGGVGDTDLNCLLSVASTVGNVPLWVGSLWTCFLRFFTDTPSPSVAYICMGGPMVGGCWHLLEIDDRIVVSHHPWLSAAHW